MSNLTVNSVKLTQMSQYTVTHLYNGFHQLISTTYALQAFWQKGYCSNPADSTTFQAIGAPGSSRYTTNTAPTVAGLYTNLVTQIQTDTGLTFTQNAGTSTLFDAFSPVTPGATTPPSTGTTQAVTGVQLACPVMLYTDGAGNYFTLSRYTLMNGSTVVSGLIQTAATPAVGDAMVDAYNNIAGIAGSQTGQTFTGIAPDTFSDPYST